MCHSLLIFYIETYENYNICRNMYPIIQLISLAEKEIKSKIEVYYNNKLFNNEWLIYRQKFPSTDSVYSIQYNNEIFVNFQILSHLIENMTCLSSCISLIAAAYTCKSGRWIVLAGTNILQKMIEKQISRIDTHWVHSNMFNYNFTIPL